MSYRLLRGWKSLGPDHGFSIQLQPRPGSRGEASPPALVKGWNIEVHEMIVPILRTQSFVFVVFSIRTFFTQARTAISWASSAKSPTGCLICSGLSDTCWKLFSEKRISKYVFILFKFDLGSYRNSYSKGSRACWTFTWLSAPLTVENLKWQLENVPMRAVLMLCGKTRRLALGPPLLLY